jgi:spermidine synthase
MEAELRIELLQLYLMFPVSVVSGMLFTLIGQAVKRKAGSAIRVTGQVTLLNTLGAAFGSLAGGFLLIPYLGMEVSFFVLAAAYGVVALLARKTTAAPNRLATIGAVIAWLMTMILFPFGAMENSILSMPGGARRLHEGGGYVPVFYREGPTETIQYHKRELAGEPLFFKLVTNNHSMSSSAMRSKRYMKMFVYWPVAVNPNLEDALLISYGVGSTAKALTDTRSLRTIDVVDISRDILDASAVIYPDPTENPLNDPRVRVHVEDGRFFLRTTSKRFDLVTAEPPPPRFSGIVNLYSREYFRLVKDRLREGGIVTHWLPVYQLRPEEAKAIQRGFCDVFPDCSLWTGRSLEWMMVGVKGALATPSVEEFSRPWRDPIVGPELSRLGFRSPAQFGSLFIADGERLSEWMGNTPPLTDNHPQRLRSRPTRISRDTRKGYEAFMDDPAAGESFRQSPMIAGLWPAPLREAALDHFPARNTVNRLLVAGRDVSLLHETLSNPLLAGYASWAMGSDAFAYGIADRVSVEGQGMERVGAEILPHLAASAVVRNDYGLAARFLGAEAAAYSRAGRAAPEFCFEAGVYLHLIGGEEERAKALHERALRHAQDESRRREIDRFLVWAGRAAEKLTSTPN